MYSCSTEYQLYYKYNYIAVNLLLPLLFLLLIQVRKFSPWVKVVPEWVEPVNLFSLIKLSLDTQTLHYYNMLKTCMYLYSAINREERGASSSLTNIHQSKILNLTFCLESSSLPRPGTCFLIDHRALRSNTGPNTCHKPNYLAQTGCTDTERKGHNFDMCFL